MIAPGTRLGPYEIQSALGAGGMGEVYKAIDARLGRTVAIKVLPEHVATDLEFKQRFEREAKTLAALSHPHICPVFDVGSQGGIDFLVMEHLDGETLEQRLKKGALPLDQALQFGIQIADALAAAHRAGIVHRDLKPGNVMLTRSGAKLLDFGLAKSGAPATAGGLSMLPTTPPNLTAQGTILGTFQYMAPEQLEGREADARTDIFAFGAVVYEMVTSKKSFEGKSHASLIAAIMDSEPPAVSSLQPMSPPLLDRGVKKCLAKNPDERWQSAHDVRDVLQWIRETGIPAGGTAASAAPGTLRWRFALLTVLAALLVTAVIAGVALRGLGTSSAPASVTRLAFMLPEGDQFEVISTGTLAISPDGTRIAYATRRGLYTRSLADFNASLVVGGPGGPGGGSEPTFSPDGRFIAFFADGWIRRVAVSGGTAVAICPLSSTPSGMSWGEDGIVFAVGNEGIFRVSSEGGVPERLISLTDSEWPHRPQMLPGGERVLFGISSGVAPDQLDASRIVVQSIASGERKILVERGRSARYLSSGHLAYARGAVLFVAPINVQTLEQTGPAVPMIDGVRRSNITGTVHYSASETGALVYIPGPTESVGGRVDVVVADRAGTLQSLNVPAGTWEFPRVPPDGARVALGTSGPESNVWIYDLTGAATPRRLTFQGRNRFPIWSADGRRIAFQSDREGDLGIFWQPADGTGPPERLTRSDPGTAHVPDAWSPKGDAFLFTVAKGSSNALWRFATGNKTAEPFGKITADGRPISAAYSPDGRWVVYNSTTPIPAVYVQPVPITGATYQVSIDGGFHPWWSRDGKSIIYIPGFGRLASIGVVTEPDFRLGAQVTIPRGFNEKLAPVQGKSFDLTADGRFIGLAVAGQGPGVVQGNQINVVLNWLEPLSATARAN